MAVHYRPGPYTFAQMTVQFGCRPSAFGRTVHFHPFGPPTLKQTLFSKLFFNKDISFLLDYSLLHYELNVVGKGNWKKMSWKLRNEVGKFQLSWRESLKLERSYRMIHTCSLKGRSWVKVNSLWKIHYYSGLSSSYAQDRPLSLQNYFWHNFMG